MAATRTPLLDAPRRDPEPASSRSAPRRVQVAQILAFVALVAALVGALGPAKPIRTTYSWPPKELPNGNPSQVWYTPLLLAHRVPESLSADLPCALPPPLSRDHRTTTVLATARHPELVEGLAITTTGRAMTFSIGATVLDRVAHPASSCPLHLAIENGSWSLTRVHGRTASGRVQVMPTVNGLFSEVDMRSGNRPSLEIAVVPQSARPIARQTVAWALAAICALGALLLVSLEGAAPRTRTPIRASLKRAASALHPADGAIVVLLPLWLILSPANPDDGWVVTRQRMFDSSGGFSNYFDALGTNLPLGYWLEWVQHWLTTATTSLVVLRIPALVCILATWILCRWMLARVIGTRPSNDRAIIWCLAAAFVLGSFAWDMTLRPEPAIALLTAAVLATTVAFVERQSPAPLAFALVLVALAITVHPSGIVSVAPLLAAGPTIVRWARAQFTFVATMLPAAIALAVTLATLGSDVAHRSTDTATFRTFGDATLSWRDELLRYEYLTYPFFGTPLRRVSVALMMLVAVVYVLRRRRTGGRLLDLPARALGLALALLVLNPDKLSFHFGTLLALGAVAAATETRRLTSEASTAERSAALPLLWVGGAVIVAAWAWPVRRFWDSLDLRTLSWTLGLESVVSLATLAALVPVVALLVAGIVGYVRAGRGGLRSALWRVAPWSVPLLVVPVLLFTVGVLSADAAKTGSWTLTRQNLGALRGNAGCGLADDLVAPALSSLRPLPLTQRGNASAVPAWVPLAPAAGLTRYVLGPRASGSSQTPWFSLGGRRRLGLLAAGAVTEDTKLTLQFARLSRGRAHPLAAQTLSAGAFQGGPFEGGLQDTATWVFFAPSESAASPGANAVRVVLSRSGTSGESVAVTSPVTYETISVGSALTRPGVVTMTNPFVLTYFPCAREPLLSGGIVKAPHESITFPSTRAASPTGRGQVFTGASDVFPAVRLPLWDSKLGAPGSGGEPVSLVLYEAMRFPGAMLAPPQVVSGT